MIFMVRFFSLIFCFALALAGDLKQCNICLDSFEQTEMVASQIEFNCDCKAMFCKGCCSKWVQEEGKTSCPGCRAKNPELANCGSPSIQTKRLFDAIKKIDLEEVELAIENGADMRAKEGLDNPLLFFIRKFPMCTRNGLLIVESMINKGADINAQNLEGKTPLISMVEEGSLDGVKMLLRHGALVDCQDISGNTALHQCVKLDTSDNQLKILEELLKYKPDLTIKNKFGRDALDIAIRQKSSKSIKKLVEHGVSLKSSSSLSYLEKAFLVRDFETIKTLLDLGCEIEELSPELNDLLRAKVIGDSEEVIRLC